MKFNNIFNCLLYIVFANIDIFLLSMTDYTLVSPMVSSLLFTNKYNAIIRNHSLICNCKY